MALIDYVVLNKSVSRDQNKSSSTTTSSHSQKRRNHGYKAKSKKEDQSNVKDDTTAMMEGLQKTRMEFSRLQLSDTR